MSVSQTDIWYNIDHGEIVVAFRLWDNVASRFPDYSCFRNQSYSYDNIVSSGRTQTYKYDLGEYPERTTPSSYSYGFHPGMATTSRYDYSMYPKEMTKTSKNGYGIYHEGKFTTLINGNDVPPDWTKPSKYDSDMYLEMTTAYMYHDVKTAVVYPEGKACKFLK